MCGCSSGGMWLPELYTVRRTCPGRGQPGVMLAGHAAAVIDMVQRIGKVVLQHILDQVRVSIDIHRLLPAAG